MTRGNRGRAGEDGRRGTWMDGGKESPMQNKGYRVFVANNKRTIYALISNNEGLRCVWDRI